jgi:DNA polymerase-1
VRVEVHNVRTMDDVARFQRWLSEDRKVLAFDIETTGLDWRQDKIRLAQFGDTRTGWVLNYEEWRGVVRDGLLNYRGQITGHNIRFDLHFITHDLGVRTEDLPWWRIHDTMNMAHLIDPTRPKGLKPLAARHIDAAAVAGQRQLDDDMRRGKWDWATVPIELESYRFYAGLDTILSAILWEKFHPYVMSRYPQAYELEQIVSHPLFAMERHGMLLDADYTQQAQVDLMERASQIAQEVHATYGLENIGSNPQLRDKLLEQGWVPDIDQLTPAGLKAVDQYIASADGVVEQAVFTEISRKYPSLRAEVLEELAQGFPLAHDVVQYRLASKASSTWLQNFLDRQDPETGRVHPSIRQVAARTGRMSISDPALQTLPREADARAKGLPSIRDCFVAPEGHRLISADFASIEARLFAHFSGEPDMLRTIHEGGDLHALVAASAYQIPVESVTKDQRQIAKAVSFASLYGAGPARVATTAGITFEEAQDFFKRRDEAFPGIRKFQRGIQEEAQNQRANGDRAHVTTHVGSRISILDSEPEYRLTNYCLTYDTQALTLRGWQDPKDLLTDDNVLGYVDGELRWTEVREVMHFPQSDLVQLTHQMFEVKCTPNHRWITENGGVRRADDLQGQRLRISAPCHEHDRSGLTEDESAVLAWLAGDGHLRWHGGTSPDANVFQSRTAKPEHHSDLCTLMSSVFGDGWSLRAFDASSPGVDRFHVPASWVRSVWERLGWEPGTWKEHLPQLVPLLGPTQREAYVNAFFAAEGSYDARGHRTIAQNPGPELDAVKLACFLRGGHAFHSVSAAGCATLRVDGKHPVRQSWGKGLQVVATDPEPVWCLRNDLGSFVARNDRNIFLTGNSIQGSAAVVLKDRIVSLHNAGLTDMMLLPIHDEVLFEVPVEDCEEVTRVIEANMPDRTTFDVPLDIEVSEPALSWGAAK